MCENVLNNIIQHDLTVFLNFCCHFSNHVTILYAFVIEKCSCVIHQVFMKEEKFMKNSLKWI